MKNKKIFWGGILATLLAAPFLAMADEDAALARKAAEKARIEREIEKYKSQISAEKGDPLAEIREKIDAKLSDFDAAQKSVAEMEKKLRDLKSELLTLDGQLKALQIAKNATKKQVEVVKKRLLEKMAEMKVLAAEKEKMTAEKDRAMRAVLDFFALLQTETDEKSRENAARFFLSDETFSENARREDEILAVSRLGREIFHRFEEKERDAIELEKIWARENERYSDLFSAKKREEKNLSAQILAEKKLRKIKENSAADFEKMLEKSREEMKNSVASIGSLKFRYAEISAKLDREAEKQRAEKAAKTENSLETTKTDFQKAEKIGEKILENEKKVFFSWPVLPKNGISAGFLDPDYKKIFGVPHLAIDIPTPQGTIVRAPALGYVYKITDNGDGYNSLILAHRNNFLTVYGHVSAFLVKEGDLVRKGDPIAKSGGTPGTPGAGWMTTGPHLHFEVIRNGKNLNPINFLPPVSLFEKK